MNLSDYQREAERTMTLDPARFSELLCIFTLGLAGESGEVVELVKKRIGHGHELDREKLRKELGDVLWYLAALSSLNGLELSEVAAGNVLKLRARYPEGFSYNASKYRLDEEGSR